MSRLITNAIRSTSASADAITMDGSGNVTFPANATCSGTATGFGGGKLLQVVSTTKTDTASNSTATQTYWNYTDFKVTITPSSASSKILITAVAMVGVDTLQSLFAQLRKDGSVLVQGDTGESNQGRATYHHSYSTSHEAPLPVIINYLDTAGNTNQRYYNLAFSHTSSATRTMYLNRGSSNSNSYYYGRSTSTITAQEIAA